MERLNKYIARNFGISRREADDLIAGQDVLINEKPAKLGDKFQTGDEIKVLGKNIKQLEQLTYLLFNKPVGYVCSRRHQSKTPTIYDILPKKYHQLKTVGRLDKDSSGLIILTNDGDFAFQYTHPKFYKTKTYEVGLDQPLEPLHQQMIADFGIELKDGRSNLILTKMDGGRKNWLAEMSEGRNRQIRRTFGALGYTVISLRRIRFGKYKLEDLNSGEMRELTAQEL